METKPPQSMGPGYQRELAEFSIEAWTGDDIESTMRLRALGEISLATATDDLLRMACSASSPRPPEPLQRLSEAGAFQAAHRAAPRRHASIR